MNDDPRAYVGTAAAAAILGLTEKSVRNLAVKGRLRFRYPHGRPARQFFLCDVLEFRDERLRHPERRGRKTAVSALLEAARS